MTDEKYLETQEQLKLLAQIVHDMPLEALLARIDKCETVAPILDPTLFMQGSGSLEQIKALATGAVLFQRAVRRVAEGQQPKQAPAAERP